MLSLCHWELNEGMSCAERMGIAKRLLAGGLFPPPGVELLRRDETPDAWGILLFEAGSPVEAATALALWRAGGAGFSRLTKTSPAFPINKETMQALEKAELAATGA